MNPETIEILEQYALGVLHDREQQEWIERELDRDSALADAYCRLLDKVTPCSLPQIRGMFGGLERSVWATIGSPEGFTGEGPLETDLQLPSVSSLSAIVHHSPAGVRLEFASACPGWRPMSLAVFQPEDCTWQPIVLRGDAVVAPTPACRIRPGEDDHTAAVSLNLNAQSMSPRWESGVEANAVGGCAWLAETIAAGLVVRCTLPEDSLPLGGLRCRLRRRPPGADTWQETYANFPAPMHVDETLRVEAPLGVQRAIELQRSHWEVVIESVSVQEVPYLKADQFRAVAGPEVQVLPLVPTGPGESCLGYEAKFVSPAQHAWWSQPGVCRVMRWEPIDGEEGQRR